MADEHPFREDIRALHLLALYRAGRQTEALAAFRRTRDLLVDELGVEPGPELRTLHRRMLEQDERLDLSKPPGSEATKAEVTLRTDNLRPEPNAFVERPETAQIVEALRAGRVVTVVGTGGIGKSRCVAAAANRCLVAGSFADGIWLVDLAPLPEGSDDVAQSVAHTMGLGQQPGVSISETLIRYLANRRVLLVLDNCEHVASATAAFADALLAGAPTTAILAASRVRLDLPAESVVTAGRLPKDAAQTLLVSRIAEAGAGPFTDDECAELCATLDNYPLAIELAAARTRTLAPREIVTRLAEQPRLLGSSSDTKQPRIGRRHADLSTALDWSLAQLSASSRDTLRRVAVFVSDFDLDTAEAVLSTETSSTSDVVEDLGGLVEHHLVNRDHGRARFRVLEPIRQHLFVGSSRAVTERCAEHFAGFAIEAAAGLRGPDEAMWWDRWHAEFPHVREAVRLLVAERNVERLDAIMAQVALTSCICVVIEPGEWAVDALRTLELDPVDAPGVAAAAAAHFAQMGLIEECDAILDALRASVDSAWMRAVIDCVQIYRDPSGSHMWAEQLQRHARECADGAMLVLSQPCRLPPTRSKSRTPWGTPHFELSHDR